MFINHFLGTEFHFSFTSNKLYLLMIILDDYTESFYSEYRTEKNNKEL